MDEQALHATENPPEEASPRLPAPHTPAPLRPYFVVYGALMVLLVLTVGVAQFHLGTLGIVLALIIAISKAVLVLIYFMHLRHSSRLTWIFATAGFVWLMILFFFLILDYVSRGWVGQ